jgi:hypothetical protein
MSIENSEIKVAVKKLKNLAATNSEFRELVINSPQKALSDLIGKQLPDDFKINIVESDPQYSLTILLPVFQGSNLNEGQLDSITGGYGDSDINILYDKTDPSSDLF